MFGRRGRRTEAVRGIVGAEGVGDALVGLVGRKPGKAGAPLVGPEGIVLGGRSEAADAFGVNVGAAGVAEGGLGLNAGSGLEGGGGGGFSEPSLAELVDDAGEVAAEDLSELTFDLPLDVALDDADGVEAAGDFDGLEGVVLEDEGDAFLSGNDEHDDGLKFEVGEAEGHRDDQGLGGEEDGGGGQDVEARLAVGQRIGLQDVAMAVQSPGESKMVEGESEHEPEHWSAVRCRRLRRR